MLNAPTPWDDRPACQSRLEDLSGSRVREHLRAVWSALLDESSDLDLYRRLRLSTRVRARDVPRNVGLLLFSLDPAEWFPGARIEVTRFSGDPLGEVPEERTFHGGLADQVLDCQFYLERQVTTHFDRDGKSIETPRWDSYPSAAIRELLVNAVIHRAYGPEDSDPIRVRVYPDRLTVTSYPGPVPGIEPTHFLSGVRRPAIPARNRRIADFLKERGLVVGRRTGVDTIHQVMKANGSPPPEFTFDEERTYFAATLPAHPDYIAIGALREAAHLEHLGRFDEAERRLDAALDAKRTSGAITGVRLRLRPLRGDRKGVERTLRRFRDAGSNADDISRAAVVLRQALKALKPRASDPGPDRRNTASESVAGD